MLFKKILTSKSRCPVYHFINELPIRALAVFKNIFYYLYIYICTENMTFPKSTVVRDLDARESVLDSLQITIYDFFY